MSIEWEIGHAAEDGPILRGLGHTDGVLLYPRRVGELLEATQSFSAF